MDAVNVAGEETVRNECNDKGETRPSEVKVNRMPVSWRVQAT